MQDRFLCSVPRCDRTRHRRVERVENGLLVADRGNHCIRVLELPSVEAVAEASGVVGLNPDAELLTLIGLNGRPVVLWR